MKGLKCFKRPVRDVTQELLSRRVCFALLPGKRVCSETKTAIIRLFVLSFFRLYRSLSSLL